VKDPMGELPELLERRVWASATDESRRGSCTAASAPEGSDGGPGEADVVGRGQGPGCCALCRGVSVPVDGRYRCSRSRRTWPVKRLELRPAGPATLGPEDVRSRSRGGRPPPSSRSRSGANARRMRDHGQPERSLAPKTSVVTARPGDGPSARARGLAVRVPQDRSVDPTAGYAMPQLRNSEGRSLSAGLAGTTAGRAMRRGPSRSLAHEIGAADTGLEEGSGPTRPPPPAIRMDSHGLSTKKIGAYTGLEGASPWRMNCCATASARPPLPAPNTARVAATGQNHGSQRDPPKLADQAPDGQNAASAEARSHGEPSVRPTWIPCATDGNEANEE
jgi:hypothetical protein